MLVKIICSIAIFIAGFLIGMITDEVYNIKDASIYWFMGLTTSLLISIVLFL